MKPQVWKPHAKFTDKKPTRAGLLDESYFLLVQRQKPEAQNNPQVCFNSGLAARARNNPARHGGCCGPDSVAGSTRLKTLCMSVPGYLNRQFGQARTHLLCLETLRVRALHTQGWRCQGLRASTKEATSMTRATCSCCRSENVLFQDGARCELALTPNAVLRSTSSFNLSTSIDF